MRRNIFEKNMHLITNKFNKKAFTLAEILIVLTVIGVLTSILLPVAIHSAPDEKVMKFKKGHMTLFKVVNELVNSDKYYLNGDLGVMASGTKLDETKDNNKKYLCETFADILSTKKVNCSVYENYKFSHISDNWNNVDMGENGILDALKTPDDFCKKAAQSVGEEIVTSDGIIYYETSPGTPFGIEYTRPDPFSDVTYRNGEMSCMVPLGLFRLTAAETCDELLTKPIRVYKPFCMDIDGIGKGEDPFGYGIRIDGKIILGARAQEWFRKNLQDKE